jgi:hypothetical protein
LRALLLAVALLMLPSAAFAADEAEGVPMSAEEAAEAKQETRERDARDQLQDAKLAFQRGDFERAVQLFEGILGSPVALRTADDLQDAFLHHAFTLFLMGDKVTAGEVLGTALKLKPEFVPSPVTTRPDLRSFYDEQRQIFLAEGGTAVLPGELFPELAGKRFVKTRRELPMPLFGIRLRQLGRPALGDALMTLEFTSLALNAAGWILLGSVRTNYLPFGDKAREAFFYSNPFTFGFFWGGVVTELIVTAVLNRRATLGEDVSFRGQPDAAALRREAAFLDARRKARVRVRSGPQGLVLQVW